jgi:hypothetical protein
MTRLRLTPSDLPRHVLVGALTGMLVLSNAMLLGLDPTPQPRCAEANSNLGGSAAALRPSDVLLAIVTPRAGEMVPEVDPTGSLTVSVDYWGPHLVVAATAHKVDDYHLVFFLDISNEAYVGGLVPTPRCNPKVVHTTSTSATFEHVPHGAHSVRVMLVGSNDVSVNPPVAASTMFVSTGAD